MWLQRILARARDAGNATYVARPLRILALAGRRGGIVRTGILLLVCGLLFAGIPLPLTGMLLPVAMLFIGEAEFSRLRARQVITQRLVWWRVLNTLIASA